MGRDSHGCCKQLLTANAVICPDSLMDKTGDSGSSDAGSIPVRDARGCMLAYSLFSLEAEVIF